MPVFKYKAINSQGQEISGRREADSRQDLANSFLESGFTIISIRETLGIDWKKILSMQIGGVPLKERLTFAKQFYAMLSAGLPLVQSLEILVQQTTNVSLKESLQKVYEDVSSGVQLSTAFSKHKSIFTDLQINLMKAGEKSGNLNEIMLKISDDLENSNKLRGKIVGALIYPIIIFVVLIIVVILMLIFMVPSVENLFDDFGGAELPGVTAFLVNLSSLVANPIFLITAVIVVLTAYMAFNYYKSQDKGELVIDRISLKIPIYGKLIEKVQLAEFNRIFSLLLISGVQIVDALYITADALSNRVFKDVVKEAAQEISKGNSLSIPLAKSKAFPPMMVKMISTGEQTGKLDTITGDMSKFYSQEVEDITNNLSKLLEPMIMLLVGGVVLFMAIAIYLPIFQLSDLVQ